MNSTAPVLRCAAVCPEGGYREEHICEKKAVKGRLCQTHYNMKMRGGKIKYTMRGGWKRV